MTHWAERPLYNWSEWHGGERWWIKALVGINFFPFHITRSIDDWVMPYAFANRNGPPFRAHSWMCAWVFAILSSSQWFIIGWVYGRSRESNASNSTLQPTPTRAA